MRSSDLFGVLVYALCSLTPTWAQPEQTPEGAQQFIQKVLSQGTTTLSQHCCNWPAYDYTEWEDASGRVSRDIVKHQVIVSPSNIRSITSNTACATTVAYTQHFTHPFTGQASQESRQKLFDWTKIAGVIGKGPQVFISSDSEMAWAGPLIPVTFRFNLPSEALATRLAYAMEFLRIHCDSTAGTGF